jgi:hypothetical protein
MLRLYANVLFYAIVDLYAIGYMHLYEQVEQVHGKQYTIIMNCMPRGSHKDFHLIFTARSSKI